MEAFRNGMTLGVNLDKSDQIGADAERELAFALAAVDVDDPSTLRWVAACAIARALELEL